MAAVPITAGLLLTLYMIYPSDKRITTAHPVIRWLPILLALLLVIIAETVLQFGGELSHLVLQVVNYSLIAALLFFVPGIDLSWQLFVWAILSGWLTFMWFRFFKPFMADRTKAGISREAIVGETGHVITAPGEGRRGTIRFSRPLLGSDEWPFICDHEVTAGDRVVVREVSGNTLIVEKKG